jgi:NAD(P)-dependent dehydrogenase (short-subunit alcohol dehydrogenase family)
MMDLQLKDLVVMVTGASGEIGAATALEFAREGARVIATFYNHGERADTVVRTITAFGGTATAVRLDQADPENIRHTVAGAGAQYDRVDVLVANAVVWPQREESWNTLVHELSVNVAGTISLAEAVIPAMRSRQWGRIVLVSSDVVDQPMPAAAGYPAAKAAIEAAARVFAVREASNGVLSNVVRPGFTLTERARSTPGFGQSAIDAESEKTPTRRISTPEDVAHTIAYLGSGANTHVNGEIVSVAGGRHLFR